MIVQPGKPAVMSCPRCSETNSRENKFCSKCSYSLVPEAYDEVKASERKEMDEIKRQYSQMNTTLQNINAIMVSADEATKKTSTAADRERGIYAEGKAVKPVVNNSGRARNCP